MAYARVITIGRNDRMPKVVRLPMGVGVDGFAIMAPVTIAADEGVCPDCGGFGYSTYTGDNCDRCNGGGIITLDDDTEPSAVYGCLSAAEEGRPAAGPSAGRLTSSGMTPDARATGGLSYSLSAGTKTHPLLQGVPSDNSASHSPVVDMPPIAPPGALAEAVDVLLGLAVFGSLAYLFLVLA